MTGCSTDIMDSGRDITVGRDIHALARRLWPINRSITGNGVRETLGVLQELLPNLTLHEVPTGMEVLDWTVPKEWNARAAWIKTPGGEKICDFAVNNLHLMGYSTPIHQKMPLSDLDAHLYTLPDQPDAIPYVTSYYTERWGFCLSQNQRDTLPDGEYEVFIDTTLADGQLTYGELILPGETEQEIFLSTYVCHPSMANNELSGPTVTAYLAKWISELSSRKYTYRIVFIPETIGSITYLSRNVQHMKDHVFAGFNISCVGDDRAHSYLPSRRADTPSDEAAKHVLKWLCPDYDTYPWSERGSDERQYCAPGIDLPIASMMRSKYNTYPEYHTSLDDLENVVTPAGLQGGYDAIRLAIEALERNCRPRATVLGEPQMGRRGLYPTVSTKGRVPSVRLMMDLLTWSDGETPLLEIADRMNQPIWTLYPVLDRLVEHDLLEV